MIEVPIIIVGYDIVLESFQILFPSEDVTIFIEEETLAYNSSFNIRNNREMSRSLAPEYKYIVHGTYRTADGWVQLSESFPVTGLVYRRDKTAEYSNLESMKCRYWDYIDLGGFLYVDSFHDVGSSTLLYLGKIECILDFKLIEHT